MTIERIVALKFQSVGPNTPPPPNGALVVYSNFGDDIRVVSRKWPGPGVGATVADDRDRMWQAWAAVMALRYCGGNYHFPAGRIALPRLPSAMADIESVVIEVTGADPLPSSPAIVVDQRVQLQLVEASKNPQQWLIGFP